MQEIIRKPKVRKTVPYLTGHSTEKLSPSLCPRESERERERERKRRVTSWPLTTGQDHGQNQGPKFSLGCWWIFYIAPVQKRHFLVKLLLPKGNSLNFFPYMEPFGIFLSCRVQLLRRLQTRISFFVSNFPRAKFHGLEALFFGLKERNKNSLSKAYLVWTLCVCVYLRNLLFLRRKNVNQLPVLMLNMFSARNLFDLYVGNNRLKYLSDLVMHEPQFPSDLVMSTWTISLLNICKYF